MHQICNWTKNQKFTVYVLTFEKMKIQTLSVAQNDCLNLVFGKDINISVHILIGSKMTTSQCPRTDLSKRFLPRANTITAISARIKILHTVADILCAIRMSGSIPYELSCLNAQS